MTSRHARRLGSLLLYLLWPWPAIRRSASALLAQREQHRANIAYIGELVRQAKQPGSRKGRRTQRLGFDENWRRRVAGAPGLAKLRARFLRQKRVALATSLCFIVLAAWLLAHGNPIGIATLLSSLPLCFMSCLSAQLRLWQLRVRRLSITEHGGLTDFIREEKRWVWQVLDPRGRATGTRQ